MSTTTTVPSRDPGQRMAALAHANEIRLHRAQLKRHLKAGRIAAAEVIQMPYSLVDTMKVLDVLIAMPKYARVKANGLLRRCDISPSKTLAGLSDRQRGELLELLRGLA